MVWRTRASKPVDSYNIATILSRTPTKGLCGIEIEVEGNKFPIPEGMHGSHHPVVLGDLKQWSYVHDGSLRGDANAEYVLTAPIKFEEVPSAVTSLFEKLRKFGSVIADSNRTSVHVHLNAQQFHLNRLASFIAMYVCVEEVLTEWCGEHRVGNLFCLRTKDAPSIISRVRDFIKNDGNYPLRDNLHYAGLNIHSLTKFGSVEVRTLRGCSDAQTIIDWVSILQRLYEFSAEFPDPRDICSLFSQGGPQAFFETIFGDRADVVRAGCGLNYEQINEAMYQGIRLAQDICYCRDWSLFKAAELQPDPFGRDARKLAQKVAAATASLGNDWQIYTFPNTSPSYHPAAGLQGVTNMMEPEYDD